MFYKTNNIPGTVVFLSEYQRQDDYRLLQLKWCRPVYEEQCEDQVLQSQRIPKITYRQSQHYKPCHRYGCLKVGENSSLKEILNRLIYPQPQARMTCQIIPSVANECGVIPICKLHNNCERDRTKLYHTCIWQTSKTSISMPNNHHKDNYI